MKNGTYKEYAGFQIGSLYKEEFVAFKQIYVYYGSTINAEVFSRKHYFFNLMENRMETKSILGFLSKL